MQYSVGSHNAVGFFGPLATREISHAPTRFTHHQGHRGKIPRR